MSRLILRASVCVLVAFMFGADSRAQETGKNRDSRWRFPLMVSYTSGFADVKDYYEQKLELNIDFFFPIGVAFSPYFEIDYSEATGSAFGVQVGPMEGIFWEQETSSIYGSSSDTGYFFNIPLILYYGQVFLPKKSSSPYVKVGVAYPLVSADGVDETSAGAFAAVGVDFMRQKRVALGAEIAVDKSTVTFGPTQSLIQGNLIPATEIEPVGVTVSFRIVF